MRHIISLLIENESGALSRVAGLYSARGYNIESLTVAPTDDPSLSRMTIVTFGNDTVVEQIAKQTDKLIDVVRLVTYTETPHVERELMMVKLRAVGSQREEATRLVAIFRGKIVDVTDSTYVVEVTGDSGKIDAFLAAVPSEQILEVVRSGVVGIARGESALKV